MRLEDDVIAWTLAHDEASGLICANLKTPEGYFPVCVQGLDLWEREYETSLPTRMCIHQIWTFLGHDAGDRAESDINIETATGIPLVQRSEHRLFVDYDADVSYEMPFYVETQELRLFFKCNNTTHAPCDTRGKRMVRYHAVIRIIGEAV